MRLTGKSKIEQKPDHHNGTTAYYKMLVEGEETGVTMVVTGPDVTYKAGEEVHSTLVEALVAAGHEVDL